MARICRVPQPGRRKQAPMLGARHRGMLNVVAMDVTDAQSVRNAATQLKDVAIDVLINSAGIAGASGQKTGNVDYVSWAHVLNVNTMGPLRVLESFSNHIAGSERRLVAEEPPVSIQRCGSSNNALAQLSKHDGS